MEFLIAFVVGGLICVVGQLLIDFTKLTPARILVLFVTLGVFLTAVGYTLAKGTMEAVESLGFLGAFTGGVTAAAAGIGAAVFFGYIASLCAKPSDKG